MGRGHGLVIMANSRFVVYGGVVARGGHDKKRKDDTKS